MNRIKLKLTSVLVLIILGSGTLIAHDFWLIPEFFNIPSGVSVHVYANNGSNFPESLNAVEPDRIRNATLVGKNKIINITNMKVIENSLVLDAMPTSDGQWYIGVETKPKTIALTGAEFNEYLEHDGLPDILALRKSRGELDKDAVEFYQKSAKAIIQSGKGGPKVWDKPIGHLIEFIPQNDPMMLISGSTLKVQLLFKGEPLANQVVSAGSTGSHSHDAAAEHTHTNTDRTDSNGMLDVKIGNNGKWYLRTTYMQEVKGNPEYNYESFWATLTFEVK